VVNEHSDKKERKSSMGFWGIIAFIAIWLLLQLYILPKLGIST